MTMLISSNSEPRCACASPTPFVTDRRLLPVYETNAAHLIQLEVVAYCSSCLLVVEPGGTKLRVTEAQVRFDRKSQPRLLVGAEGNWKTLELHDWHALKRYGISPIKIRREVIEFDEAQRRKWMLDKLNLGGEIEKRTITDVFGRTVSVNARIVEKTLQNATRTPWVVYAMLPLAEPAEVWENADRGEMRRYYMTPFQGDDPDESGIVAVSAKDNVTGEDVVFNVFPIGSSYANSLRKGRLLFISYPEEALCHHGCCSDCVDGFAERAKLAVRITQKDAQIQKLRSSVKGLQQETSAGREARARLKADMAQTEAMHVRVAEVGSEP